MTTPTFELRDEAPPTVFITGRPYNRYDAQAEALRANPGRWLMLTSVEINRGTVERLPDETDEAFEKRSASEAEKDARRRAGNRAGMVRQGKGSWAGAEWDTRIAQPGGPGTPFELWVSFVRAVEAPAASDPVEGGEDAQGADVSADAAPGDETSPEPTPRRRRG